MKELWENNKFLVILITGVLVVDLITVSFLFSNQAETEELVKEREKLTKKLEKLTKSPIKLVKENDVISSENLKISEESYRKILGDLSEKYPFKGEVKADMQPTSTKRLLNKKVALFDTLLSSNNIAYEGQYSYGDYLGRKLPKYDELEAIQKTLWVTEQLVTILSESGITGVNSFVRPKGLNSSYKASYGEMHTFDIEVEGNNSSFIKLINSISNSEKGFFVIRYVNLKSPSQLTSDTNPVETRKKRKSKSLKDRQNAFQPATISVKISIDWVDFKPAA